MNFRKLKIFFETAQCLNMTKVAKSMYISQPSISQAIAELESDLDVKLFDRIGKKLYLTHEGEIYFEYSRRILNLYEEANNTIKSNKSGQKGKIVIGASTTIGIYILPELIKEFNEAYKNIEISLIIENTQIIEKLILENKVDIALVEGNVTSQEVEVESVGKDELVFIANPNNPIFSKESISLKDLENEKFIMREAGSGTREIVENYLKNRDCNYKVYMELGNTEAIVRIVEAGLGIACVSCKSIGERIEENSIKEICIDDVNIKRDLYLIYHKDKFISKNMETFINEIKSTNI
ncbi:selenium metabolism-associated LysR family transcriptional regulator [Clostridium sp. B9]|uniref:selenium metabolism-associated LysR family transcriptional regulator n=1 Tax=Clostridium sp. B9 TaxID=3423224 RepID=UPI003D2EF947